MKPTLILTAALLLTPSFALGMDVTSTSIEDERFDVTSACADQGGDDFSPQVSIADLPDDATHYAIILDDPDAQERDGKTWVHWNVVNIPVAATDIDAGGPPPGTFLPGDNGEAAYAGLCPEDGPHMYRLGVFALSAPVDVEDAAALTLEDFQSRFGEFVLGEAQIQGSFP